MLNNILNINIMTTTENNKLIAEFMGFELTDRVILPETYKGEESHFSILEFMDMVRESDNLPPCSIENLKFHSDWNWLMEVVEKIESLIFENDTYYNVQILSGCCVYIISSNGDELVCSDNEQSKLDCVYNACIEFIKWWNENK
jgi:hypothetical protein